MSVEQGAGMTSTETRAVIDRYFDLMGQGEDFATCYADDVSWMTFDGGTTVVGPPEVRDYLVGLHGNMPDSQTRPIVYADQTAYVEGDCADPRSTGADRIAFCGRLRRREWPDHFCTLLWSARVSPPGAWRGSSGWYKLRI